MRSKATKQSSSLCRAMDCFASLAMTVSKRATLSLVIVREGGRPSIPETPENHRLRSRRTGSSGQAGRRQLCGKRRSNHQRRLRECAKTRRRGQRGAESKSGGSTEMFTLMVRSASLRVSNHEAEHAAILRDARLRRAPQDEERAHLTSTSRSNAGSGGCPPPASGSPAACWRGPRRGFGPRARSPRRPSAGRCRAASQGENHGRRGWQR